VINSGAFGWGFSVAAGWLGSEEHPARKAAAKITANSFIIILFDFLFFTSPARALQNDIENDNVTKMKK
jgi:hypothetical protein